jgi:hypothetical protein
MKTVKCSFCGMIMPLTKRSQHAKDCKEEDNNKIKIEEKKTDGRL